MEINKIVQGHVLQVLKSLPEKIVDSCVTSPPYWSLRSYKTEPQVWDEKDAPCVHNWTDYATKSQDGGAGSNPDYNNHRKFSITSQKCAACGVWKGELGLEPDFNDYIRHLVQIFSEVKRVLKDSGSLWVNLGDTYYTKSGSSFLNDNITKASTISDSGLDVANSLRGAGLLPNKCLVMIPFRFAVAMVEDGWVLRNTVIWAKESAMPSSTADRFNNNFEYFFFFVKSRNKKCNDYYFEQQFEPVTDYSHLADNSALDGETEILSMGKRNKRAVWTINNTGFEGAHFATFNFDLIKTPILATCPEKVCIKCGKLRRKMFKTNNRDGTEPRDNIDEQRMEQTGYSSASLHRNKCGVYSSAQFVGWDECECKAGWKKGVVMDVFMGSGSTALAALRLNRDFIGVELNKDYVDMAQKRIAEWLNQRRLEDYETAGGKTHTL